MAIYQFYIATIPKKNGVIEYFIKVPTKLELDSQRKKGWLITMQVGKYAVGHWARTVSL